MTALAVGLAVAAVVGLTAVLLAGRAARRRARAAALDTSTHPHYCAACDQEWPHPGRTCLRAWAWPCPKCADGLGATEVSARSPAA
jgi:hypothetical protein